MVVSSLMLLCNILGPVNLSQKYTNTHSYIQNIHIHVRCFFNHMNIIQCAIHLQKLVPCLYKSTAMYFLWLHFPLLLMISNYNTTLQSFLTTDFFPVLSSLSFILSLSCLRNQAMMSCSGICPHFHNLDKPLNWFKEEL